MGDQTAVVYGLQAIQRELDRIDGEPMDFEWITFPGFTTLQILLEIQKLSELD